MKIVIAFLAALLMFLALKAIRLGLKRLARLYPAWDFRADILAAIEFIIWLIFIFWASDYLFRDKFYYRYLVLALILVFIAFLSWFLISDIFAGVIFKVKHNLKTGAHIRTGDISGNIKSQHLTYLKIRTDDGQLLRVPYSSLNNKVIAEVMHTETMEEHTLQIRIDVNLNKTDAETLIREKILNTPWSNVKEEPSIRLIKEDEKGSVFEIMLFSMNQKHRKFIEMSLQEIPSARVLH